MKKLFYVMLSAFVLALASCSDNVQMDDSNTEFKFQKEITISDANGNTADVIIHANSQDIIDDHTVNDLVLTTTTEKIVISPKSNTPSNEVEEIELIAANDVFILVKNHNLNTDVTGFSVRSKFDIGYAGQIKTRASSAQYQYSYGSEGTIGAFVSYAVQTCNKEFLTTKLRRRKTNKSKFWVTIGTGNLPAPGDSWSDSEAGHYWYKLQIKAKNQCSGTAFYNFNWLT